MPWIGIRCDADMGEMTRWAAYIRGAGSVGTADFLERAVKLLSGRGVGASEIERMREIEGRADAAVERKRAEAAAKANALVAKAMGKGLTVEQVMNAAGKTGWAKGYAGGDANAGVRRKRRAFAAKGAAAVGPDGEPAAMAEKGKPPLTGAATVERDRKYGKTFEAWCAVELRKMGFKVRHVARGVGMTPTEAWRHMSGFERHWRRQALAGVQFPEPSAEWRERLEEAVRMARGEGLRGANVVLNGGEGSVSGQFRKEEE